MNIDKIVKECTRAVEDVLRKRGLTGKLNKYEFVENTNSLLFTLDDESEYGIATIFHYRELFDYFDSVGIVVGIELQRTQWQCSLILRGENKPFVTMTTGKTRTEAEYEAFERAFEIREQQIEQNSKEN